MMEVKEKLNLYQKMVRIRCVDDALLNVFKEGIISGFLHTSHGHEAVGVGVVSALSKSDQIVSYYRGHSHYIARDGNLQKLFDEILGKESGICGGLGGSLHLVDKGLGFMATSGIVAEAIPLAIGLALANKLYNKDSIVVVFFGDGATNSGVFYESLNFAAFLHLKILFVCENNGFSQSERTSQLMGNEDIANKAISIGVPGLNINGTDVISVYQQTRKIIDDIKEKNRPFLLNCYVKRLLGHTAFDGKGARYRSEKEYAEGWNFCPLKIFREKEVEISREDLEVVEKEEYLRINNILKTVIES